MTGHQMINGSDTITGDKSKIKDGVEWPIAIRLLYYEFIDVGCSFFQNSSFIHPTGTSNLYPTL